MKYLTLLLIPLFIFASKSTFTPSEYLVDTKSYSLSINALDATVSNKIKK